MNSTALILLICMVILYLYCMFSKNPPGIISGSQMLSGCLIECILLFFMAWGFILFLEKGWPQPGMIPTPTMW